MTEEQNHPQVEAYLDELSVALGSRTQAKKIREEVCSDLTDLVERYQREGRSEEAAVERALEELGNPYELAHRMIREIPPFGGVLLSVIRYVAAGALLVWTAMVLWIVRAGQYGFEPTLPAVVIFLHLPAILLLWPRLVWKRNWLFGWLPAMAVLLAVMALSMGGVEIEASVLLLEAEAAGDMEVRESSSENGGVVTVRWVAAGLTLMTVFLLLAMQQRSQRRWAMAMILLVAAGVEAPFQLEEGRFRRGQAALEVFVERKSQEGVLPTEQEVRELLGNDGQFYFHDERHYSLFWNRPLCHGYAIVLSSRDNSIRVQD